MISGSVKIEGLKDFEIALAELPKSTARRVLQRAAMAALEPMRQAAIHLAPDDPKTPPPYDLKSSIATSIKQVSSRGTIRTYEGDSRVYVFLGPGFAKGMSKEQAADLATYSMAQEFGAKPHSIAKGSGSKTKRRLIDRLRGRPAKLHPGHAANPYMRPAFDAHYRGALDSVRQALTTELEKVAQRLAKKAARLAAKG